MSVIGINGSPRSDGNTNHFVREVLAGAAEAGAQTRLFNVGELTIAPCCGCVSFNPIMHCSNDDDMRLVQDAVVHAPAPRGLVIGTPIYFDHITAQLKALLDRLYCYTYTDQGNRDFPAGYRAVLVASYDSDSPNVYDFVLTWLQGRLEYYYKMDVMDHIVLQNATNVPLSERPELIERARKAGQLLVTG